MRKGKRVRWGDMPVGARFRWYGTGRGCPEFGYVKVTADDYCSLVHLPQVQETLSRMPARPGREVYAGLLLDAAKDVYFVLDLACWLAIREPEERVKSVFYAKKEG
jgi:hypothetical protein